jgi:hypothetical protein
MNVEQLTHPVKDLVAAFKSGQLLRNDEYQRGEAWSETQKAGFIDSLFRLYPVPALFLWKRVEKGGLDGAVVTKFEIVDGQQRLTALRDFADNKFELLPVQGGTRLRLPKSVAARPAPWACRNYEALSDDLRLQFDTTRISVFVIGPETHADEIRDLFIRLQSGTALSRQQIRDAWPGKLGPYIEKLAGKLDRRPTMELFGLVDKRGQRLEDEDARDLLVPDRQLCGQLLRVFVDRDRDPHAYPSVSANDLDSLYHELTDFDTHGDTARRFEACLKQAADVFRIAQGHQADNKNKFRRLEVTAVMMLLQDLSRSPLVKVDTALIGRIVGKSDSRNLPSGKTTRGSSLRTFYEAWRESVAIGVVRLDDQRMFDDEQKRTVKARDRGLCGVCHEPVMDDDAEYDHFPVPWRDGGRTSIDNCRLVHERCHPRGRPVKRD